jgi:hypothetical protein
MNNIDCLKELTESIVKKQNDSLESLKRLSQATDIVSSDISNLINSLRMVGNRQFTENRVQDDEPLAQDGRLLTSQQVNKKASSNSARDELSLHAILRKAIKLLPPEKEERELKIDGGGLEREEVRPEIEERRNDREERKPEKEERNPEREPEKEERNPEREPEKEERRPEKEESKPEREEGGCLPHWQEQDRILVSDSNHHLRGDSSSKESRKAPLNRDRVADILKKYSLYDDDEDEDDEDFNGD